MNVEHSMPLLLTLYLAFFDARQESAVILTLTLTRQDWAAMDRGLIILLSFAEGASDEAVHTAARTVLTIPLLTLGVWGDGENAAMSVIDIHKQGAFL